MKLSFDSWVVISVLATTSTLFLIWIAFIHWKLFHLKKDFENASDYLVTLIIKHNLLCKEVINHARHLNSHRSAKIELFQRLSELEQKVVGTNNQTDWDAGESWKEGFRPDGSKIDDEDDVE